MPVSTRSKIFSGQHESNTTRRTRAQQGEESPIGDSLLRNPHQGLKEKMKALTLLYEQQQQETAAIKNASLRLSTHPSVELLDSSRKEEREKRQECVVKERESQSQKQKRNLNQLPITKPAVLPDVTLEAEDAKEKENLGDFYHMVSFSRPKKETGSNVVRKLSMGTLPAPLSEVRPRRDSKAGGDLDAISENSELGSRILVFVRLRPMAKKEKETGARCCVRIDNRRDVYLTEFATENDYLRLKRVRGRHFAFDASFPDSTSQHEVYAATTANLVEAVLQGRNGSVFCYGATGAGKTYTMLGTVDNPGVMVLAIKDLFAKIRQRSCDGNHVVHLSYMEVYNETVRDLISPGRPLVLREDKQGIVAAGLTQYRAYSTDEVMALLQQGNQNRTTEPTRVNETSSRSHAILQVIAEYRVKEGSNVIHRVGKLSLIDLAGSERSLATDQRTLRSLEGANINRSLLALSSCINALVEGKKHIPYRNSKLTQLLKDSLGGSCSTVMIANISPSNLSLGETQNTLHWADRAKEIRTKACPVNEEQVPESETDKTKVLIELQKENRELRMQLARQQQKLLTLQAQTLAANPSPSPSVSSVLSPPRSAQPSEKRRPKTSLLAGNCFSTPYTKKKGAEETVKELRLSVKALEAELDRLKKDQMLQINQKDDIINELLKNNAKPSDNGENVVRVVTRASLRKQQEPAEKSRLGGQKASAAGELKNPSLRFVSPVPAAKKRSFWDITTANSPSVVNLNGRKTRSHVMDKAPSMLLQLASPCFRFLLILGPHFVNYVIQPGFARQIP
ncbi:LOW QUALITY PROTEIN: kinesin-like protein KIN-8A [Aristolochia californica]|uniref:LOW QUALITY PROTEIN: kinesin-like protein KIN-8A n=1 Tax=Aristolochia californica TaxID=171875 RepID=UPI0035DA315C